VQERLGARPRDRVVGDRGRPGPAVDAVPQREAGHAIAHLIDHPGEVAPEPGRQRNAEPLRNLGRRGKLPVNRIQGGGRHADAHLPRARLRLLHVANLENL